MTLQDFFENNPELAVAFSGGVDSAYLLYAAKKYGKKVKAYYVHSAFQPAFELGDARRLAAQLEVPMEVLEVEVLKDPDIVSNPPDRCYFCKKTIFSAILEAARREGFSVLADGTNASDLVSDRPGMRALTELQVRSPLRECGLTKAQIRSLSREAGLFTWDKPAYACLATRIAPEVPITAEKLHRTEQAEKFLFDLGLRDFRVRTMGEGAKLQIREEDFPAVARHRQEILSRLGQMYEFVVLDLEVRHGQ